MKKLIVGLLATVLMAAGLVAFSSGSANAGHCPYTGCVDTDLRAKAWSPKPGKVIVKYRVAAAGNATPRGKVRVILKRRDGDVRRTKVKPYPRKDRVVFRKVPAGRYKVVVKFIPRPSSAWGHSRDKAFVRVR